MGGQKSIKMADLRAQLTASGLSDVQTYRQSGNVIFSGPKCTTEAREGVQQCIRETYGFDVPIQVFTAPEWQRWVGGNPFIQDPTIQIAHLHLTLLAEAPRKTLSVDLATTDEWHQSGRAIYLYCPNGYGRSKLTNAFWERISGCLATTRNWKTVRQLAALLDP